VIAGAKSDRDAHYLDPTLLYPVTWDDKIMEDEVFGPILPILTYKSFDEAMARMAKTDVRSPALSSAAIRKPSTGSSAAVLWWRRRESGERSSVVETTDVARSRRKMNVHQIHAASTKGQLADEPVDGFLIAAEDKAGERTSVFAIRAIASSNDL